MIVGGYAQFMQGLASNPTPLEIRYHHCIARITYAEEDPKDATLPIMITCDNGDTVHADAVVVTVPLGVLKSGTITFDPPLPESKQQAISHLGFGLLNKVSLV
jgi:monoamine oxidase